MTRTTETKTAQQQKTQQFIDVIENWPLRRGKKELLAHLNNEEPTLREAALGKCYDCMGGYDEACDCMIPSCTLYPWMPYREGGPKKRAMSEEARKAAGERLQLSRQGRPLKKQGAAA